MEFRTYDSILEDTRYSVVHSIDGKYVFDSYLNEVYSVEDGRMLCAGFHSFNISEDGRWLTIPGRPAIDFGTRIEHIHRSEYAFGGTNFWPIRYSPDHKRRLGGLSVGYGMNRELWNVELSPPQKRLDENQLLWRCSADFSKTLTWENMRERANDPKSPAKEYLVLRDENREVNKNSFEFEEYATFLHFKVSNDLQYGIAPKHRDYPSNRKPLTNWRKWEAKVLDYFSKGKLDGSSLESRLWNFKTGKIVCDIPNAFCTGFSPDGKTMVTQDSEYQVQLWDLPPSRNWPLAAMVAIPLTALTMAVIWCLSGLFYALQLFRLLHKCRRRNDTSFQPLRTVTTRILG